MEGSAYVVDSGVSRSVRKKPGSTTIVWMPKGATSGASDSIQPSAELRGRVCGAEFLTDDAAGRGDRDDQAGALLTHDGQHSPGDVQRAEKIRLDLCPEVVGADLLEESRDEGARIVDQNVDPAEPVDRRLSGGL